MSGGLESGELIRGRLCAVRLPPKKAQEARARLRREQGAALTQESIATAEFVVVFTTVPKKRLSADRVMELYSLRWQVELHIKRDKSIRAVDELQNFRADTIHSWICAKLLAQQIAHRIATPEVAFPPQCRRASRSRGLNDAHANDSVRCTQRPCAKCGE